MNNNVYGQLTINSNPINKPSTIIDLESTLTNSNVGAFTAPANIATATPGSGQLNSNTWAFVNDGANATNAVTFGGTFTGGKGTAAGAVANNASGEGWYNFTTFAGNHSLGWQPTANHATPATITLKLINNQVGATTITRLDVSYKIYEFNDVNGTNRIRFYTSPDNTNGSYTERASLAYTSSNNATGASWSGPIQRSITLNVNIPVGGEYYIRWFLDGTGTDQLAIDDISLAANPEGAVITSPGAVFLIDFDNTVNGVNNGTFTADAGGFLAANPALGQMSNTAWDFQSAFVGTVTQTAATFAGAAAGQGVSLGNVTTGGWYGFKVPVLSSDDYPTAQSRALGWQPDATNMNPGAFTLRVTNITGGNLQDFRINYTVWSRNDQAAANRVRVYISQTNDGSAGSYVLHPKSEFVTTAAPDGGNWLGTSYTLVAREAIGSLNVADGSSIFLRFYMDYTSGAGTEGDELAIDDISIIGALVPINSANPNRDVVWAYDGFDYYSNFLATPLNLGGVKGVKTDVADYSTGTIPLHGISTNTSSNRFRGLNSPFSLGWAGDWLSVANPNTPLNNVYVTNGKEETGTFSTLAKPSIPITSASQAWSLVNSGMYVEGGGGQVVGRRLQTSTAGYAFQYTATNPNTPNPCLSISGDCQAISPLRLHNDVRVTNHNRVDNPNANSSNWSHTYNTLLGAQGSTVWVGVMLRKNANNNDPVFISLHRNANPFDITTNPNDQIQIGYFGGTNPDGTDADGYRHWGVRVGGNLVKGTNINTRITTAQDVGGTGGQPGAGTIPERTFDLLVARIDYAPGAAVTTSSSSPITITATAITTANPTVLTHGAGANAGVQVGNQIVLSGFGGKVMNITDLTYTPTQVTITHAAGANTGILAGSRVFFAGIGGNTNINGRQGTVDAIISSTQTRFNLDGVGGTYTGGGTATVEDFNGRSATVTALTATTTTFNLNSTTFTPPTSMGVGTVAINSGGAPTYAANHRVRLYVIRDIARDNDSPNVEIYPLVPNPHGYPANSAGANFDAFISTALGQDDSANPLNLPANIDVEVTGITNDISFHSVAYFPGNNPGASAMDELRIGGTFKQAASSSNVISLIRGLCSANGGSLGAQAYEGGDFGEARCMRADGSLIDPATINITGITLGTTTTITHASGANSTILIGDLITFSGIVGTVELNGITATVIGKTLTETQISINSTGFTPYVSGGQYRSSCTSLNTTATETSANLSEELLGGQGAWNPRPENDAGLRGTNNLSYLDTSGINRVVIAPGSAQVFNGGPRYNALSGGQYVYRVNTNAQPNDGAYTVATQSRPVFSWISYYDNSPNKNGYLMQINASYSRGKFFDQTIAGLCPDTQYEFSVDIVNVIRRSRTITNENPYLPNTSFGHANYGGPVEVSTRVCDPNLEPGCAQFSFAGTSPNGGGLGIGAVTNGGTPGDPTLSNRAFSLNPEVDFLLNDMPIYAPPVSIPNPASGTGAGTPTNWRRIGLTFVTKANLSTALNMSMRNIAPGGMGNDLAIDNISFRPCGSSAIILDDTQFCQQGSPGYGKLQVQIGKAGAGLSQSRVRLQKWSPVDVEIRRKITNITKANPAVATISMYSATSTVGDIALASTIFSIVDVEGMTEVNGNQYVALAKTANTITLGQFKTITNITNSNPVQVTLSDVVGLSIGTVLHFGNVRGMTQINGQTGAITDIDTANNVVTIGAINTSDINVYAPYTSGGIVGFALNSTNFGTFTGGGQIRFIIPSDDTNGNGIAEENEWRTIYFNPIDGKDYSDVAATTSACLGTDCFGTDLMPVIVSAPDVAEIPPYPNGTEFRALYAGNTANLENGRCRFIVPGFAITCVPLGVSDNVRLSATKRPTGIQLKWKTSQKDDFVSKYILERSYDEKNFVPIADYPSRNAIGDYQHLDDAPYIGKNYYRVRVVETSGKSYYTNVVSANWNAEDGVIVYPNPASDKVNIVFSQDFGTSQQVQVRVLNTMGVVVNNMSYTLPAHERNMIIDTQSIAEGLYLLEINIGTVGKIVHKMVIKR
jgi:hypothetical protein